MAKQFTIQELIDDCPGFEKLWHERQRVLRTAPVLVGMNLHGHFSELDTINAKIRSCVESYELTAAT